MTRLYPACLLALSLLLPLASPAFAVSGADTFYDRGLAALDQLQQLTREQRGDAEQLSQALRQVDSNMAKAAELGHPAAALYQAQMRIKQPGKDASETENNRREGCQALGALANKGFVAAAVLNFRECDAAFKRFDYANAEHQSAMRSLQTALDQPDPASAYYPLADAGSQCFANQPGLSEAQFRSEAAYILGSSQQADDRASLQRNLDWLEHAYAEGCSATADIRTVLRKQLAKPS